MDILIAAILTYVFFSKPVRREARVSEAKLAYFKKNPHLYEKIGK